MAVEREVNGPSKVEGPSERDFVDRDFRDFVAPLTFGLLTFLNNVHLYLEARMVLSKGSALKPGIHKRDF